MKQIVVHQERCTACRECEMACSFEHEGAFVPALSRIRVNDFYEEQFYLPMTCVHCADAPCATVCPTVAIVRQESGQVQVLAERCIGCKMCLLACPFGVMGFSPARNVAHNCDLCGDHEPQCVAFCVPQALEYADVDTHALAQQKFAAAIARKAVSAA
jgi:anaerobic carbon-monoxide dehydrogenase iron sulfur subunit